jgi:hypothetical protein
VAAPHFSALGITVTSDTVYLLGSPQVDVSYRTLDGKSILDQLQEVKYKVEFNYSETASSTFTRWKATSASPEYTSADRGILVGSFKYEGARLVSGTVNKVINWSHFHNWNQNVITVQELKDGYYISDGSNLTEWEKFYDYCEKNGLVRFKYDDINWEPTAQEPPKNSATVSQFLESVDGARYFKSNWYNDPTGINVIADISLDIATKDAAFNQHTTASEVVSQWVSTTSNAKQSLEISDRHYLDITASSWSDRIRIKSVAQATSTGSMLEASQIDFGADARQGSVLNGSNSRDELWGKAGWDILDGGAGNDLIRAGNGRDIIIGGLGADELHGDFGWNTYKSEKDGVSDLIAIKSDQYLSNWIYGKAGNNADGSKCDIIEGLDAIDKIRIIGVDTRDITFAANVTAKGLTGIGIYGKGALEALYTGGDLTINQITQMTSGDASSAAMANQVNSYGTW